MQFSSKPEPGKPVQSPVRSGQYEIVCAHFTAWHLHSSLLQIPTLHRYNISTNFRKWSQYDYKLICYSSWGRKGVQCKKAQGCDLKLSPSKGSNINYNFPVPAADLFSSGFQQTEAHPQYHPQRIAGYTDVSQPRGSDSSR